ncbi:MAG: hypothetical protein Q4F84_09875 [Fibrobacter sp.]|nr:hypothetical protein [Fibrobacter sp.]
MSLSGYLQTPEFLKSIPGKSPENLKSIMLEKGHEWFKKNEDETNLIRHNLEEFGFCPETLVPKVQEHIILHYYEKLLPLSDSPEFFFSFLKSHVDSSDAAKQLELTRANGKGIIVAIAHFGAVEFIVPTLASFKFTLNTVLRFTTEQLSVQAHERARMMQESGLFGQINFIEAGKPGVSVAMSMAAAIRRKELLVSVFDEKTDYSKPVTLLGKKVSGGAGLDKIVKFANTPTDTYTAFMKRNENNTYTLMLKKIDEQDSVQNMFGELEKVVKEITEQWYFLHEEIPFLP